MVESQLNREYALRMAGVGALMLGISCWSLYDGFVAWPEKNRILAAARADLLSQSLTAEAWVTQDEEGDTPLKKVFSAKGLPPPAKLIKKLGELKIPSSASNQSALRARQSEQIHKLFSEPIYHPNDLTSQSVQAGITLVLALMAFGSLANKGRRRFIAGPEGFSGSGFGNSQIPYGALKSMDWRRWEEKGIVVLLFDSGKRIKLDAWHYSGVPAIVDEIKKQRPELVPSTDEP